MPLYIMHTTRRTLKQMGSSSRRKHRVPLLSAKNRKRRLQFTQAHQNWKIQDWKNIAWSDVSRFLLRHSDGKVRIWHKEHESMDPSCLVSTVQAAGDEGDIFLALYIYIYIYIYSGAKKYLVSHQLCKFSHLKR